MLSQHKPPDTADHVIKPGSHPDRPNPSESDLTAWTCPNPAWLPGSVRPGRLVPPEPIAHGPSSPELTPFLLALPETIIRGAAERGHGKVERGHRWGRRKLSVVTDGTAGKRSAVPHFYPYRTRIGSHNLPLATACTEYTVHMPNICTHTATRSKSKWTPTRSKREYIAVVKRLICGCICATYTKLIHIPNTAYLFIE